MFWTKCVLDEVLLPEIMYAEQSQYFFNSLSQTNTLFAPYFHILKGVTLSCINQKSKEY